MKKEVLPTRALGVVRPILLIGANVNGKPNFMTVGSGGLVSMEPPMVAVPLRHYHYTLKGIMENRTLSVNVPSVGQMKEADYCGIISGSKTDKVKDCNFRIFYGKLNTAPMIEQCPVNLECSVMHILSSVSHSIIIGRIEATYVSQEYLKGENLDTDKIDPLIWFSDRGDYVRVGQSLGKSHSIGRELKDISG